jgi:signal transduction histidine kinase
VTVAPGKRRFEFRFTALSLSAPEKVRFRHKIDRLDADWSRPDAQRTADYSYIPPGHHTLRVAACNNDGVWNEEGRSLLLVVEPFFWQTWWFKVAVGLALAAALALSVRKVERWNARLRLERLQQQHAIEHERSRIAQDIHDDLGAHLTQIIFLSQRVEATSTNPAEVEHWLQLIPATARRTIRSLDEIVWAINPKHDTLESLANYLSQFAQDHLTLAGIRCVLDVPTVLPPMPLGAEIRHNLVLAAREAVQNAVAHAGANEVRVGLELADQELRVSIADDGRGFDVNGASPDGNGLHNMRRRLEDIGGRLVIDSHPGGTTVTLAVPRTSLHGRVIAGPPAPP